MNSDRLIKMILGLFMQKAMSYFARMARKSASGGATRTAGSEPDAAASGRDLADKARKSAKLNRRIGL